jgi:hypothetical protein
MGGGYLHGESHAAQFPATLLQQRLRSTSLGRLRDPQNPLFRSAQMKNLIAACFVGVMATTFVYAQSPPSQEALLLRKLVDEIDTLRKDNNTLKNKQIPVGAVIAFDGDKCPADWAPYPKANGRVFIGAVPDSPPVYPHTVIKSADFGAQKTGGTELTDALYTIATVETKLKSLGTGLLSGTEVTFTGNGTYHIIPPYIALTFCMKV